MGAVCRAMMTMGFTDLVLADCPEYEEVPVKTFALKAFSIYEAARRVPRLHQALEGSVLAAGFTRRVGRMRAREPMDVRDFAREALRRKGKIALVFGNERNGLSREEIALCDIAVRIPTSDTFPSLNLAQAVQIVCWQIFCSVTNLEKGSEEKSCFLRKHPKIQSHSPEPTSSPDVATFFPKVRNTREFFHGRALCSKLRPLGYVEQSQGAEVSRLNIEMTVDNITNDLYKIGFFKIAGRSELSRFLRSILSRAGLAEWELEYLVNILGKASTLFEQKNPKT